MINDIGLICDKMNESGKSGTPFLFAVSYDMTEGFFIKNPIAQNQVLFSFLGKGNKPTSHNRMRSNPRFEVFPIEFEQYREKFDAVQQELKKRTVVVANLTVKTPIKTDLTISDIFNRSQSPYQLYVPDSFVCFSPERFVKIENGTISSNPMKGTIDASRPDAEQVVLADPKEKEEHEATVRLICEELKVSATNVHVKRARYVDRIETMQRSILQVSSEVVGELPKDYRSKLGNIVFSMLPAGSVTGSPKLPALEQIEKAEQESRGYYCGVAGYFDGTALDSAVLIRFIEKSGEQLFFRSGGGITVNSACEKEYREVVEKIYLPFL